MKKELVNSQKKVDKRNSELSYHPAHVDAAILRRRKWSSPIVRRVNKTLSIVLFISFVLKQFLLNASRVHEIL